MKHCSINRNLYTNFSFRGRRISYFFEKALDIPTSLLYNTQAVSTNAAIAQPVERILGKDEVASSNLASSSKKTVVPFGTAVFLFAATDLKDPMQRGRALPARAGPSRTSIFAKGENANKSASSSGKRSLPIYTYRIAHQKEIV